MYKQLIAALLLAFSSFAFSVEMVDINSADAATIATNLKGIGATKAAAIVAYRKSNGPFSTVDDLMLVKGVGEKTVNSNRSLVSIGRAQK